MKKTSGDGSSRSIPHSLERHATSRRRTRHSCLAGSFAISGCQRMVNSSKDDAATDGDMSSGGSPPSNSSLYSEGEKVLAYHGPRIYEAKVHLFLRSCLRFAFGFLFKILRSIELLARLSVGASGLERKKGIMLV